MKMRVAVVQFGAGNDVEKNLATCLRMIDRAAREAMPNVMVLPEFANHCAWYPNQDYANEVALDLNGNFLQAIADKAAQHNCYIKINVTLKKEAGKPTVSNLLYSPAGKLAARADKQVLMGNENNFCSGAETVGDVLETEFGRIGMYACADGLLNEPARVNALRGAQLLLNSLNSFAADEASLHIPARAAENRVFVAAACKVDYLIPLEILEKFAAQMKLKPEDLQGAGESQIVAPDGTILAKAPRSGEAVAFADLDLSEADDKRRPDGTDIFAARRPVLYRKIAAEPVERNYQPGARQLEVAVYHSQSAGEKAIEETAQAVSQAAHDGVALVVLPELFCFENNFVRDAARAAEISAQAVERLTAALKSIEAQTLVVTSLVEKTPEGFRHLGVCIGQNGVVFAQPQLHFCERHKAWASELGQELNVFAASWGKLAVIVGDDAIYPESFRLAALENAEVVALPMQILERWEMEFGLPERAAENRLSIVAASRPAPNLGEFGRSAIITVGEDFTLWTEWKNRPFDGNINYPIVQRAADNQLGLMLGTIFPANADNRFVSQQTDVVDGRPWRLIADLAAPVTEAL